MIATLSSLGLAGAWALLRHRATAAVTGPFAQAIGIGVGAFVLVLGIGIGVWALRADARKDEAARWEARLANVRAQALALRQARERQSEKVAADARALLVLDLEAARLRLGDLEAALATRQRTVCYPKEIVGRLNR
jgi:hypothetical protein